MTNKRDEVIKACRLLAKNDGYFYKRVTKSLQNGLLAGGGACIGGYYGGRKGLIVGKVAF